MSLEDTAQSTLSAPKATLGGIILASLAAVAVWFRNNPSAIFIILCGIILVVVLLLIYFWLLRRIDWRRAMHLEGVLKSGANHNLSKEDLAKLAEASKAFQEGLDKFRSAKKSLTSIPWYVVVGESGGGKTEAIRNGAPLLPPPLNNKLAGKGGTLHMHWWFTRDAILLDTAGKWLMEDDPSWPEFLKHLKEHRKECPINGLFLIIPARSLMSDKVPGQKMSLAEKAEHLGERFAGMQQILGVRFPVYIIITKCDLIEGFNEFFHDLKDGKEINQILGWSNPAPLNEAFRPELVDEHLKVVRERLLRRRLRLLSNPIHTDDPMRSRIEQVDALYTLPDSLLKIGPRLKQTLDTIFSQSFSDAPLFLRGIYFTSSMQEGSPFDLDLATAMGVTVDSLPKAPEQDGQRSYFLRDLFSEKVFQEKGLVTRAVDVDQSHRRKKVLLMGSGIAAALLLIGVTIAFYFLLNKDIGYASSHWKKVWNPSANDPRKTIDPEKWAIVQDGRLVDDNRTPPSFPGFPIVKAVHQSFTFGQDNGRTVHVPAIFFGQSHIDLKSAQTALVQISITRPACQAVRDQLKSVNVDWSNPANATMLEQLIRLEADGAAPVQPTLTSEKFVPDLAQYLEFSLKSHEGDVDRYKSQKEQLDRNVQDAMVDAPKEINDVSHWTGAGSKTSLGALQAALSNYVNWCSADSNKNKSLEHFTALNESLKKFEQSEWDLARQKYKPVPTTMIEYKQLLDLWRKCFKQLEEAGKEITDALPAGQTVTAAFEAAKAEASKQQNRLALLLAAFPREADKVTKSQSFFATNRKTIESKRDMLSKQFDDKFKQLGQSLSSYQARLIDPAPGQTDKRFAAQLRLCKDIDEQLTPLPDLEIGKDDPDAAWVARSNRLNAVERLVQNIDASTGAAPSGAASATPPTAASLAPAQSAEAWTELTAVLKGSVLDQMARPLHRYEAASVVTIWPDNAKGWEDRVAVIAVNPAQQKPGDSNTWRRRQVPLTQAVRFNDRFYPPAVAASIDASANIDKILKSDAPILHRKDLTDQFQAPQTALDDYRRNYVKYWTRVIPDELKIDAETWPDFLKRVGDRSVAADDVNEKLANLSGQIEKAITIVQDPELPKKLIAEREQFGGKFDRRCETVLGSWRAMARVEPRETILTRTTETFPSYDAGASEDSFVTKFWFNFTAQGLELLGEDAVRQIKTGRDSLVRLQRFPLVWPNENVRDSDDELSPKEVDEARNALAGILGNLNSEKGTFSDPTVTTGNPAFDDSIKKIRGDGIIDKRDLPRFRALQKLLNALPKDGTAITCSISHHRGGTDVEGDFEHAILKLGGNALGSIITLRNNWQKDGVDPIGITSFPGPAIMADFGNFNQGKQAAATKTIGNPAAGATNQWALLRLMLDPRSGLTGSGRLWSLQLQLPGANKGGLLTLVLEFGNGGDPKSTVGDFPTIDEWKLLGAAPVTGAALAR